MAEAAKERKTDPGVYGGVARRRRHGCIEHGEEYAAGVLARSGAVSRAPNMGQGWRGAPQTGARVALPPAAPTPKGAAVLL